MKRFEISGQDLTDFLAKELARSQPDVKLDLATVEMLKEKYAAVAEDSSAYVATAEACPKIQHTLPDGQVCIIISEFYTRNGLELIVGNMERECSYCMQKHLF